MAAELRVLNTTRLWLVKYRTPLTAIATSLGAFALAFFFQPPTQTSLGIKWAILGVFVGSNVLTVFLSITPQYYERIKLAESLLPAIYETLGLDKTARVTIHHIRSKRTQTYEQITPYYPTNAGQGRRFAFTMGITGQAFRTRQSQAYSIPQGVSLEDDYTRRWSFTKDEIATIRQDRRSFYAYPIGEEGVFAKVILYFDSQDPLTFTLEKKVELDSKIEKLFLPTLERLLTTESRKSSI
jgi:hypothetical protein